jgi:quercetin dioxygenase-like cupin family protein
MSAQTQTAGTIKKSFADPDEVRTPPKAKVEVLNLGQVQAMRATFEPGWKWSESVKPIAGTDSCQVAHLGYQISGQLTVRMDDGTEYEFGPGDVCSIPPGHDAWVIGDEPAVLIDFQGAAIYAKSTA